MTDDDDIDPRNAIFHIIPGRYVVAFVWTAFALGDGTKCDMLGMIYRDPGSEGLSFRYRTRWYADDKVWNSEDKKNVFDVSRPIDDMTDDELVQKVLESWSMAQDYYPGGTRVFDAPRAIWVRSDDVMTITKAIRDQPFASAKTTFGRQKPVNVWKSYRHRKSGRASRGN